MPLIEELEVIIVAKNNSTVAFPTLLSLFYAMAEALEIPRTLEEHVKVKQRKSGYPEAEHIFSVAANAFCGGRFSGECGGPS